MLRVFKGGINRNEKWAIFNSLIKSKTVIAHASRES